MQIKLIKINRSRSESPAERAPSQVSLNLRRLRHAPQIVALETGKATWDLFFLFIDHKTENNQNQERANEEIITSTISMQIVDMSRIVVEDEIYRHRDREKRHSARKIVCASKRGAHVTQVSEKNFRNSPVKVVAIERETQSG